MNSSRLIQSALALLLITFITLPGSLQAGGWSVVTIEESPSYMQAAVSQEVRFTVRAHGRTLVSTKMSIRARHAVTGDAIVIPAQAFERGRYRAELKFPSTGTWKWQIEGYGEHPMPDITVGLAAAANHRDQLDTTGERLFISKGCVQCHVNTHIAQTRRSIQIGPNLSQYQADDKYLRGLLADPRSVRANAEMPDLELSEADIEALVAFINRSS